MELADLQQYAPGQKLYRIKGLKPLRLTMDEFKLFAYATSEQLKEQWEKVGNEEHVVSDIFSKIYPSGIQLRKFFVRNGEVCAGIPKLFFTNAQWKELTRCIPDIYQRCFGEKIFKPCFFDKSTHFDADDSFIGCAICIPFTG